MPLKKSIDNDTAEIIINDIHDFCEIIWIGSDEILTMSAKISHGNGIPAIDAIILCSLIDQQVKTIYTTDSHMTNYKKKLLKIINL